MQNPEGRPWAARVRRVGERMNARQRPRVRQHRNGIGLLDSLTIVQHSAVNGLAITHNSGSDFPIKKLVPSLARFPGRAMVSLHPPRMRLGWEKGPPDIAVRGRKARAAPRALAAQDLGLEAPGVGQIVRLCWRGASPSNPRSMCSREKVDPCPFGAGMVFHPPPRSPERRNP